MSGVEGGLQGLGVPGGGGGRGGYWEMKGQEVPEGAQGVRRSGGVPWGAWGCLVGEGSVRERGGCTMGWQGGR